jgi:hypothetical protein
MQGFKLDFLLILFLIRFYFELKTDLVIAKVQYLAKNGLFPNSGFFFELTLFL